MKYFISLLTSILILSSSLFSQATISGSVVDQKTKEPLAGANVYLSGTTSGVQTDATGSFSFVVHQTGLFKLVASSIGYSPKILNLTLAKGANINHTFELQQRTIELDEVVVTASNTEWKNNYKQFQKFFFGNTESLNDVYIQNPEIIRFEDSNKFQEVNVFAEAPVVIVNHNLGYTIEAEFVEVSFNPENNSGIYKLYTKFNEMEPSNNDVKENWERNRSSAYEGSPTHFFKSLVQERLRKEKFDIASKGATIEPVKSDEANRLALFYPRIWPTLVKNYSLFKLTYYPVIVGHNIRYDQFDRVINDHALSYISYSGDNPYILVDNNGELYDPSIIQLSGKWGFERFSLMLPLGYSD